MSRTVTALFSSRNEAEAARIRLASDVKVETSRVLAKETAGALAGLGIEPKQAKLSRDALQNGDHMLVAKVARGEKPARIIDSLRKPIAVEPESDEPKLSYEIGELPTAASDGPVSAREEPEATTGATSAAAVPNAPEAAPDTTVRVEPETEAPPPEVTASETARAPVEAGPEVRIGERRVASAQSTSAEVRDGDFESRAPAQRLTPEEVEARGLLKDRVIEVVEMREEPVIATEVVVREEIIIRKSVNERTERIDETVRRTDVKVEELP